MKNNMSAWVIALAMFCVGVALLFWLWPGAAG